MKNALKLTGGLTLRPGGLALRPAWLALKPDWLALRPDCLGLRPAWLAFGPSRGGMDRWMDGWKISPFYRTSFPIGAAAQKLSIRTNIKICKFAENVY